MMNIFLNSNSPYSINLAQCICGGNLHSNYNCRPKYHFYLIIGLATHDQHKYHSMVMGFTEWSTDGSQPSLMPNAIAFFFLLPAIPFLPPDLSYNRNLSSMSYEYH